MTVGLMPPVPSVGGPSHPVKPALGLGFRFTVKIDGLSLGEWHACSGLSVDFQPEPMESGGNYLGTSYLAGKAKYGRVVLKRATSIGSSATLQAWLGRQARQWMEGASSPGGTATITLYDSNDEAVLTWVLHGVRPAAWKGPDLDAMSSKVAVESLDLVHGGFTVARGSEPDAGNGPTAGSPLTLTGADGQSITFPYAPTGVTVTRSQDTTFTQDQTTTDGQTAPGTDAVRTTGFQLSGRPNVTSYAFGKLVIEGEVRTKVELLLRWSTKAKATTGPNPTLPLVGFTLGSGLSGDGLNLTNLEAQYTRFDAQGHPNRASVSFRLEEPRPEGERAGRGGRGGGPGGGRAPSGGRAGARNPTSGGLPGRGVHVLHEPESLPALAQETYGDAGSWRDIAAANGIDDPMRVPPGTLLFLPGPAEMPWPR
jgi:phage tail-like protein